MNTIARMFRLALLLMAMTGGAMAGPVWEEPAAVDAGPLPDGALSVTGPAASAVTRIKGDLGAFGLLGGDFQDVFLIKIVTPTSFSATLDTALTTAGFDTELWLFTPSGTGLLGNDNASGIAPLSALGPVATDGSGAVIASAGVYFLAISGNDSNPLSAGGIIFSQTSTFEISGPDGPGGTLAMSGWSSDGDSGDYAINLTGVEFIVCPADLGGDGVVGFADLTQLLLDWGPCPGPPVPCPSDLDGNGVVGFSDLTALLLAWGLCGL